MLEPDVNSGVNSRNMVFFSLLEVLTLIRGSELPTSIGSSDMGVTPGHPNRFVESSDVQLLNLPTQPDFSISPSNVGFF